MKYLNPQRLRPGLIIQGRSPARFGRLIRWCLTKWIRREKPDAPEVWGNHTALVVDIGGVLYIGDCVSPFAKATLIAEYNKEIRVGYEVRVFEAMAADPMQERMAAGWWVKNVLGRPYDWMAFPRLLGKCLIKSLWPRPMGWEWAWFCSESVAGAFSYAVGLEVFGKHQATPLTVEKRAGLYGDKPTLHEVTDLMTAEG